MASFTGNILDEQERHAWRLAEAYAEHALDKRVEFAEANVLGNRYLLDITIDDANKYCKYSARKMCPFRNRRARIHTDDFEFFQKNITDKPYISRTRPSITYKTNVFVISYGLRDKNKTFSGVIRYHYSPEKFLAEYQQSLLTPGSRISLVGTEDSYVRASVYGSGKVLLDFPGQTASRAIKNGRQGGSVTVSPRDGAHLVYAWSAINGWALMISIASPVEDALIGYKSTKHFLILTIALIVALKLLAGTLIIRLLSASDSEKEWIEEKLRVASEINELKSNIVNVVAHELRNPLSSIMVFTELITLTSKDESSRENAKIALEATNRLTAIVNNMLDSARLDRGIIDYMQESVDVGALLEKQRLLFQPLAKTKNLSITVDAEEHLIIRSDPAAIARILDNLINNAIKFTDYGAVKLRAHRNKDGVLIEVEDSGIGIPKTDMPKLFEIFSEVDAKRRPIGKGTGLGLSLVKRTAEGLGGSVSCESEINKGTCFRVWLPLQQLPQNK